MTNFTNIEKLEIIAEEINCNLQEIDVNLELNDTCPANKIGNKIKIQFYSVYSSSEKMETIYIDDVDLSMVGNRDSEGDFAIDYEAIKALTQKAYDEQIVPLMQDMDDSRRELAEESDDYDSFVRTVNSAYYSY